MDFTNKESFLINKFDKTELELKLNELISEYEGLISRDTAVNLLARKNGYIIQNKIKISEIKKGMRSVDLEAEITMFFPIFESKGEKDFKYQRIMLADKTGTIPIIFWNEDVKLLTNFGLGDKIEIVDAYENNGELTYSYRTKMNLIEKKETLKIPDLKEGICFVKGRVVEIFPDYYYEKNGEKQVMSSFKLMQGKEFVRVIIWSNFDIYVGFTEGDLIRIEAGNYKSGEIHINNSSRIVLLEKAINPNILKGKLEDIKIQENELVVLIKEKLIFLKEKEILKFFKISDLSEDITLETILKLKKEQLKNKEFEIKIEKNSQKDYGEVLAVY